MYGERDHCLWHVASASATFTMHAATEHHRAPLAGIKLYLLVNDLSRVDARKGAAARSRTSYSCWSQVLQRPLLTRKLPRCGSCCLKLVRVEGQENRRTALYEKERFVVNAIHWTIWLRNFQRRFRYLSRSYSEVAHVTPWFGHRFQGQKVRGRSRSPGLFDWLFKSPHNLSWRRQFICHCPESPLSTYQGGSKGARGAAAPIQKSALCAPIWTSPCTPIF